MVLGADTDGLLFLVSFTLWMAAYDIAGGSIASMMDANGMARQYYGNLSDLLANTVRFRGLFGLLWNLVYAAYVFGTFYLLRDLTELGLFTAIWILIVVLVLLTKAWNGLMFVMRMPRLALANLIAVFLVNGAIVTLASIEIANGASALLWVLNGAAILYAAGMLFAIWFNWRFISLMRDFGDEIAFGQMPQGGSRSYVQQGPNVQMRRGPAVRRRQGPWPQ